MLRLSTFIFFVVAALNCSGQPTRLELLSRSDDHARRIGGAAISGTPELSADGNIVLFLSQPANLTTNVPPVRPVLNLYMFDRRAKTTTLVSKGLNGEPASADITSFEISTNNQRVLFETAASNMIANDTNNTTDVFIRDLTLDTNILVSAKPDGSVSKWGGSLSSMSGDGNTVVFTSIDDAFVFGPPAGTPYQKVFVRDLAAGTNQFLRPPSKYGAFYSYEPSISTDGRYAAFSSETFVWPYPTITMLCDLEHHTNIEMARDILLRKADLIISENGKYIACGTKIGGTGPATNLVARYTIETGATEILTSNTFQTFTQPIAISADGATLLYVENDGYRVYREGAETRVFPKSPNGTPLTLPAVIGMAAMSADGKFVTFSTEVPLLPIDGDASQFRTYLYNVDEDALTEIPLTSPTSPASDPVPSADASVVVFTGESAAIQDEREPGIHNIYAWERASGQITLLSQSYFGAFENTDRADSKIPETGAFSDDGKKMVFVSRAPATGVTDANRSSDVFVLDKASGRKQLVSIAADGQTTGSGASMQPIVSGNGQFVAFLSAATNLVATDTQGRLELYVRDILNGVTRLVRNKDGNAPSRAPVSGSLSFSADGRLLCFASTASDLDARDSQPLANIYVYNTADDTLSLVTYDATNTTGANADCVSPAITRDGRFVAFRSNASNLGASGNSFDVCIRDLKTGNIRKASVPLGSGAFKNKISFNGDSTVMYFASYGPNFYSYSLTNASFTNRFVQLVANVYEGSISSDGAWIAFTRRINSPFSTQVYLRNVTNGVEWCISSNVTAGAIGNDNSSHPQISADGRFTVFESRASNLADNDTNAATDLFLYDRDRQRLDLVSAKSDGSAANSFSVRGVICPDQSSVAFVSFASDLVSHDYNGGSDIFVAYLPAPDSDADGIDDRWELAHFGTLDHDMTGDADGDGMSDAEEFHAQTDPNQASSSLRVISANFDAAQNVIVRWISTPGRAYRVQARSRLEPGSKWQNISDPVVSAGTESAITLPLTASSNESYFRVITAD